MEEIKVLVIDDDISWLKTITDYLNTKDFIRVIGTSSNKNEAVDIIKVMNHDLVLMDLCINENNFGGIEIIKEVQKFKKDKFIVLTGLSEEELIMESFNLGAYNYISKLDYELIPDAIRLAYNNSYPFDVFMKGINTENNLLRRNLNLQFLSMAEKQILLLYEKGLNTKEIAQMLYKEEKTVLNQRESIIKKFGVKNIEELLTNISSKVFNDVNKINLF
jgi:DNA-binding NarL/FixJ family response regulator